MCEELILVGPVPRSVAEVNASLYSNLLLLLALATNGASSFESLIFGVAWGVWEVGVASLMTDRQRGCRLLG